MNILLTGCAGFIGSHATDEFLKNGYSVVGVDSLTYAGNIENLTNQLDNPSFKFYKKDICETDSIIQYCQYHNIECIVNFAAETHVDNSIKSCDSFIHSNVSGVKSLLECCKKLNIKLFHISTDEVYGSIRNNSFDEDDKLSPMNPYSATKAAAEHLVTSYHNTHGVEYIIVRPSNNYGPRQNSEKFIPTILECISNNKKIPIYGNGKNIRDWLFVKDNVQAIRFILENSCTNETYNITSSQEMENVEIVNNIISYFNLEFDNVTEFVNDRPGHDFRYSISNDKLLSLGFVFKSKFTNSLKETIKFYCEEKD